MGRAGRGLTTAVWVTAALVGCGGPGPLTVAVGTGSAALKTGQQLRVDLGKTNASIGDSWYVVTAPDPAVLADKGRDLDSDCDSPGCGGRLSWRFLAAGRGSTTIVFRYCYRSAPANCDSGPGRGPAEPVTFAVTVR